MPVDKQPPDILLVLLQTIHEDVQNMRQTLKTHMEVEPQEWCRILEDLQTKAFPSGDAEGHRKAHESEMAAIIAREEFWKKMLFEITKFGLFGVLGWMAYQLWIAFLHGPGK